MISADSTAKYSTWSVQYYWAHAAHKGRQVPGLLYSRLKNKYIIYIIHEYVHLYSLQKWLNEYLQLTLTENTLLILFFVVELPDCFSYLHSKKLFLRIATKIRNTPFKSKNFHKQSESVIWKKISTVFI